MDLSVLAKQKGISRLLDGFFRVIIRRSTRLEARIEERQPMPFWTVQYVYPDQNGKTRISTDRIEAETPKEAKQKAADLAPADEFMVSVHPESEEQTLGIVRQRALEVTRKPEDISRYEDSKKDEYGF